MIVRLVRVEFFHTDEQTDGRTDRLTDWLADLQMDLSKPVIDFRSFANASKIVRGSGFEKIHVCKEAKPAAPPPPKA